MQTAKTNDCESTAAYPFWEYSCRRQRYFSMRCSMSSCIMIVTTQITYHVSIITDLTTHTTHHSSLFTRHTSHITQHSSHITHHPSHITHHTSQITWLCVSVCTSMPLSPAIFSCNARICRSAAFSSSRTSAYLGRRRTRGGGGKG